MTAQVFELPDPNATLLEIMQAAQARGMHLIHNGREIVVSPIVPPGWFRVVAVKVERKAAEHARIQAL